jgi:hypothetical protein
MIDILSLPEVPMALKFGTSFILRRSPMRDTGFWEWYHDNYPTCVEPVVIAGVQHWFVGEPDDYPDMYEAARRMVLRGKYVLCHKHRPLRRGIAGILTPSRYGLSQESTPGIFHDQVYAAGKKPAHRLHDEDDYDFEQGASFSPMLDLTADLSAEQLADDTPALEEPLNAEATVEFIRPSVLEHLHIHLDADSDVD